MIIDAHLHCTGQETQGQVLRSLDDAGIDVGVLLAPFLSDGYSLDDPGSLSQANDHLAALVRGAEDRLFGLAVVNPKFPGAANELRRAVDAGLRGAKMVPSGWYPYDDAVQPTFAAAAELNLPLLFHSGIFIDGRSGRFCRPTFFEVLRDHPGVRVALAHLGWPWTDEAIAVGLIDRIQGVPDAQAAFRFDLSFGPPPPYRLAVLRLALEVLGPGLLQYGSDCFLPCPGAQIAERRGWLVDLLDELGSDAATRTQIFSGTAAAWLGLGDTALALAAAASKAHPDTVAGETEVHTNGPSAVAAVHDVPAGTGSNTDTASPLRRDPAPTRTGRTHADPRADRHVSRSGLWGRGWSPVCC